MNEVLIKATEDKLLLYKRELKHANKLSYHYTKLVKDAEAYLATLKKEARLATEEALAILDEA